jgi:hypothetical protein
MPEFGFLFGGSKVELMPKRTFDPEQVVLYMHSSGEKTRPQLMHEWLSRHSHRHHKLSQASTGEVLLRMQCQARAS